MLKTHQEVWAVLHTPQTEVIYTLVLNIFETYLYIYIYMRNIGSKTIAWIHFVSFFSFVKNRTTRTFSGLRWIFFDFNFFYASSFWVVRCKCKASVTCIFHFMVSQYIPLHGHWPIVISTVIWKLRRSYNFSIWPEHCNMVDCHMKEEYCCCEATVVYSVHWLVRINICNENGHSNARNGISTTLLSENFV